LDRIVPGMDREMARTLQKALERQGLTFALVTAARKAAVVDGRVAVTLEAGGTATTESFDRVLVAVGRRPFTADLGLEAAGVALDARGRITVDHRFETSVPGVHAVGDVIAGPMLAHKAEEEGIACAEGIVTGFGHVNYDAIPGVCYTDPEIATVGRTEEELKQEQVPFNKGVFHYRNNGRARALGSIEGRVKVLAHAETDRILGVHAIGPRCGDLIAEAVAAIEFGASAEDVARTSHAHPTLPEVFREACLAVGGRVING
jgi:dihydrolipoamide dehydrogenase